jgi:hypothetical protein
MGLTRVRKFYFDFQHFKVVLSFQVHLDIARIDIHVFGQHGDQVALQVGQIVRLVR